MKEIDYADMVEELSEHWDEDNKVQPDYFDRSTLWCIYNDVNEKNGDSKDYKVRMEVTNNQAIYEVVRKCHHFILT